MVCRVTVGEKAPFMHEKRNCAAQFANCCAFFVKVIRLQTWAIKIGLTSLSPESRGRPYRKTETFRRALWVVYGWGLG